MYYMGCGIGLFLLSITSIAISFFFNNFTRTFILIGAIASFGIAAKEFAFCGPKTNFFGYVNFKFQSEASSTIERKHRSTPLKFLLWISEMVQILSIGLH